MGAMAGAGFAIYGSDQICKSNGNSAALTACKQQPLKTTPAGKGAKAKTQTAAERDAACAAKFPSSGGGFAASSIGKILFKYGGFVIILAFFLLNWYINSY